MRHLSERTRRRLSDCLGAGSPALPFAREVVLQLAHPLGGTAVDEGAPAARVLELLAGEMDAARLARDFALLAAVFQNADLLYQHDAPAADAVGALVLRALELAAPG